MANNPFLCLVWALSDPPPGIPGLGPSHPWVPPQPGAPTHPIAPGGPPPGYWGGVAPPHPDQGLPGQPPGYWGGVAPPYPDQGLPGGQGGRPTHPIHIPGVPDQGLPQPEPIPPDQVTPPELPEGHEDDLIIAVRSPAGEWKYSAYDVQPDQGMPQPTPHR
jgi:hypothetical protein